ncbi:hypothetical protein HDU97_010295 [Phlyctochytrium planicorne]|nr:hypothetical protein HDU97_010295 [Phlyctochytrium planicorne]
MTLEILHLQMLQLVFFTSIITLVSSQRQIYIDPILGLDTNNGTLSFPLKTLLKSSIIAKPLLTQNIPIEILLFPGTHTILSTVTFTVPSNSASTSLLITSLDPTNPATITGSTPLDPSCFQPIDPTDPNINLILPQNLNKTLACRIAPYPRFFRTCEVGFGFANGCLEPQIYVNGQRLVSSGFPDNGAKLTVAKVVDVGANVTDGPGGKFWVKDGVEQWRWENWAKEPVLALDGVLGQAWVWAQQNVKSVNASSHVVTMEKGVVHGMLINGSKTNKFRILNALSELDTPQEVYFSNTTSSIYIYSPTGSPLPNTTQISITPDTGDSLISLIGPNITITNLNLSIGRSKALTFTNPTNLLLSSTNISDFTSSALGPIAGTNITITQNRFTRIGSRAINVRGPYLDHDPTVDDPYAITVTNNLFDGMSWYNRVYNPAVAIGGNLVLVSRNIIKNIPHEALLAAGSFNTISENEFTNITYEFYDMGAIYYQGAGNRNLTITKNYFHDTLPLHGHPLIYADDLASGFQIHSNLFTRTGLDQSIYIHGGESNQVTSNIFYRSPTYRFYKSGAGSLCTSSNSFVGNVVVVEGNQTVARTWTSDCALTVLEDPRVVRVNGTARNAEDDRKVFGDMFGFVEYGPSS